jgi:alpha,alpha-trehalose phosphorylase
MLQRQAVNLPQDIYPVDPWRIVEKQFYPRFLAQTETIFTTSNGYLGMRGSFEEGAPAFENGAYINGFYETWPICYGEEAHGFAKEGQAIVNVPDSKIIRLFVDDEPFSLENASLVKFERVLDFRAGTLDREIIWEMASGKRIAINSRRLVSYEHRNLAVISYEVTLLNAKARVMISSEIRLDPRSSPREDDPRLHRDRPGRSLHPRLSRRQDTRIVLGHQTGRSKLGVVCAVDHKIETEDSFAVKSESSEDAGKLVISFDASPEKPTKII